MHYLPLALCHSELLQPVRPREEALGGDLARPIDGKPEEDLRKFLDVYIVPNSDWLDYLPTNCQQKTVCIEREFNLRKLL